MLLFMPVGMKDTLVDPKQYVFGLLIIVLIVLQRLCCLKLK